MPILDLKDRSGLILSHVYLLLSCKVPYYYLRENEYKNTLISICILDTVASIVGINLQKHKKSLLGSFGGIIAAIIVSFILTKKANCCYFTLIGIVEYLNICNDNLSIPMASILYYKLL